MKDEIYTFEFETLVQALYVAANERFKDEIVDTEMLQSELEDNPDMSEEEFRQQWIYDRVEDWIMRGMELDD